MGYNHHTMFQKIFAISTIFLMFCQPLTVSAQDNRLGLQPDYEPTTSEDPVCFTVKSEIEHYIFATVISNYYQMEDGTWSKHRHNFRIKKGEEYPVCTTGPFYTGKDGGRFMRIKVKSLVPLLDCYFYLEDGGRTLTFYKKLTADDVQRIWANCHVVYPNIDPDQNKEQ